MKEIEFNQLQLEKVSKLSRERTFQLWYDANKDEFSIDYPSSDEARWILDIEQYETPEFIAEITRVVLATIANHNYIEDN